MMPSLFTLSTVPMPSDSSASSPSRDLAARDLVYITDNDRDAEALRRQTGATVQIRRPLLEEVLTATDEVYVTRILRRANVSDVSDVPDVFVLRP